MLTAKICFSQSSATGLEIAVGVAAVRIIAMVKTASERDASMTRVPLFFDCAPSMRDSQV
jgi:hypothetical protein